MGSFSQQQKVVGKLIIKKTKQKNEFLDISFDKNKR